MVIPWQWGQKNAISKGFCHGQGNVKEKNGMSIYNYRYQVDVYIHIYFQEGQHSPRGAWALHTPPLLPVWERGTRSSASRNLKSIHRGEQGKLDGVGAARIASASRASATMCWCMNLKSVSC